MFLKETEKKFALNVTNGKTIASLYGNIVEAWAGKRITLYKSMTRNPGGGDDVECLRIRATVPKESSAGAESGNASVQPSSASPPVAGPIVTVDQATELADLFREKGWNAAKWLSKHGIASFEQATVAQYELAKGAA